MVYVDNAGILWRGKLRYHMAADSLKELHEFAGQVGIARCWYHRHRRHPHYDITQSQREASLAAGATEVSAREFVKRANLLGDSGPPQDGNDVPLNGE
jgi:hypothetical protein